MYDVNNHPKQQEVNQKIGQVLASNIKSLKTISDYYDIDARSLAIQYKACFEKVMDKEFSQLIRNNTL